MKSIIFLLIVGLLSPAITRSAEPPRKPLKEVPLDLRSLESNQTHRYKWIAVIQKGTNTESKDYAVLVTSSKLTDKKVQFHDTITLVAAYGGTIFDRKVILPVGNLFAPEQITIDITGGGKTVRQLNYEKGEATFIEFSGGTNTGRRTFDEGILTFNTLLRVAPLLPREVGTIYTFPEYAEPILFRTHKAEKEDGPFTLSCEGPQTVTVGRNLYECVKFRLELKSSEVGTDVWVGKNNLVVKFVDALPEGADAKFLEATLQD